MRNIKIKLIALMILIVPFNVKAFDFCDINKLAKYRKLASNINISYTYQEYDTNAIFTIKLSNIYPGLLVTSTDLDQGITYNSNPSNPGEYEIKNVQPGTSYTFEVYSTDEDCTDDTLKSYYIKVPNYNPFYKDKLCKGNEEFRLCKKWLKHSTSHESFVKQINEYNQMKNMSNEKPKSEEKINPFIEFIKDYYYIFLILIISGAIYLINIKKKNDTFDF